MTKGPPLLPSLTRPLLWELSGPLSLWPTLQRESKTDAGLGKATGRATLSLMTRCLPLGEGGPLCPLPLTTYPSKAASNCQGLAPSLGWTMFSKVRRRLTYSAVPLPLGLFPVPFGEPWNIRKGDARTLSLPGSGNRWGRPGLVWGRVPLHKGPQKPAHWQEAGWG